MRRRVVFTLALGGGSSSSTTRAKRYAIVRSLKADDADRVIRQRGFTHRWNDGWFAFIEVRAALPRERIQSDGFAGYSWMVDNIVRHGSTEDPW